MYEKDLVGRAAAGSVMMLLLLLLQRLRSRGGRWQRLGALVALGEEAEGVHLPHEVGHARPSAEPEADHQHPPHHEGVHRVHRRPAWQEQGRLLGGILQPQPRRRTMLNAVAVLAY